MPIRTYQNGDEHAQARVYNAAAGLLPGFKPSKAEEIARRYQAADRDPRSRYYATLDGEVVGYALFGPNGRISYPWCLPGAEPQREPLLNAVIAEMARRGLPDAWAAYRADWSPVLDFLRDHDFREKRSMINYGAETSRIPPGDRLPANRLIAHLDRQELPRLIALAPELFADIDPLTLEQFYWHHPFYSFPGSLLALKDSESGAIRGVCLVVADPAFADPTKIDPAMPCFRLGAFGTERERHKRVNGLFSVAFADENEADHLLSAALDCDSNRSRLTHLAAQAPSDAVTLCAWYDRFFERQGSFPIVSRRLSSRVDAIDVISILQAQSRSVLARQSKP